MKRNSSFSSESMNSSSTLSSDESKDSQEPLTYKDLSSLLDQFEELESRVSFLEHTSSPPEARVFRPLPIAKRTTTMRSSANYPKATSPTPWSTPSSPGVMPSSLKKAVHQPLQRSRKLIPRHTSVIPESVVSSKIEPQDLTCATALLELGNKNWTNDSERPPTTEPSSST